VFNLGLDNQSVFLATENEPINVLTEMRKKDVLPLYHQLKGTFLSALAAEIDLKESTSVATILEEDDVLKVFEDLADEKKKKTHKFVMGTRTGSSGVCATCGLSKSAPVHNDEGNEEPGPEDEAEATEDGIQEENEEETTDSEEEEEEVAAEEETEEEASTDEEESEESSEEAGKEGEEEAEEADINTINRKNAETQERPHDKDRDSQFNRPTDPQKRSSLRDLDRTRDSDDSQKDLEEETEETSDTELIEQLENFERHVAELETRQSELLEENTRLKRALHRTLVERVVDGKIALGMVEVEDRAQAIEDHSDRTAASLADTIRDLGWTPMAPTTPAMPDQIQTKLQVAADGQEKHVETQNVLKEDTSNTISSEDLFVDVLMGRRKL
jgi:hypothetical protein